MSLLFIDVETSGLLKRDIPLDSNEQPWCCHIAAELCDDAGRQLASLNTPVRAHGRAISTAASNIHGVTSTMAGRTGVSELAALGVLCGRESLASQARYVIGHGISFDRDIVTSTLARLGRDAISWVRPGLQFICTMTAAAPFCRIESRHESGGYKWPSLDEACGMLLGMAPRSGPHNAWDDLQRAKSLFFHLRSSGAFEMSEAG